VPAPVLDGKTVYKYTQVGEWHGCSSPGAGGHQATIGILTHELSHDIGLPDLYDTDGSSEGVGNWSVMGAGSWGRLSYYGDCPVHPDAWSKIQQGWVTPTLVAGTRAGEVMAPVARAAAIYQLLPGTVTSGEYFLVENRQKVGFDRGLPAEGLIIWHVDASQAENTDECYPGGPPCSAYHYKIAVVQADGEYYLERGINRGDTGDPWPGSTSKFLFDASSTPNSNRYDGSASGVSIAGIGVSGGNVIATLSVETDTPPDSATGRDQRQADRVSSIPLGGPAGTTVVFLGTVNDPDPGQTVRFQVEVKPVAVPFAGAVSCQSGLVASGTPTSCTVSTLVVGTSYHWQARAVDSQGVASAWVPYGTNAETAADFTVATNTSPSSPFSLRQRQADGVTSIPLGGRTTSRTVVFQGVVRDPNAGQTVRLQIEVKPINTPFTGGWTCQSGLVSYGTTATCSVNGLTAGTSYRWRARTMDGLGGTSAWVSFHTNAETAADFVANTIPRVPGNRGQRQADTVSAIPLGGSAGTTVVFFGTVNEPDASQKVRLQVEVQPVGQPFTGTPTCQSYLQASGTTASCAASGLAAATGYHWQARAVDSLAGASAWVAFGSNPETQADFRTVHTISLSLPGTASGSLTDTDAAAPHRPESKGDLYGFLGVAGQKVTIALDSTAFDPYVLLVGPAGSVVAFDDDSGDGNSSLITGATLPSSGFYTIEAAGRNALSRGAYALSFRLAASVSLAGTWRLTGTGTLSSCGALDGTFSATMTPTLTQVGDVLDGTGEYTISSAPIEVGRIDLTSGTVGGTSFLGELTALNNFRETFTGTHSGSADSAGTTMTLKAVLNRDGSTCVTTLTVSGSRQ
jgi:hypothetical protein